MPTHDTALDSVRVEVAFSSDPGTASPVRVDLTQRVDMVRGIDIERGRQGQFDAVQVGRCSLTFDNTDGYLTPGNTASPFSPNVKPGNRIRVSTVVTEGNLISTENASFEGGTVGGWLPGGIPVAALTNSSTRAQHGTKSLRAVWATGFFQAADLYDIATSPGVAYTFSAYVWVPTGSPAVRLNAQGVTLFTGTASTVFDAWQRITITFTADAVLTKLTVNATVGTTAGQEVWVDSLMLEIGSTASTFTPDPPVLTHRYDGYIDEWPVAWPAGGQEMSTVGVAAHDLQSRIARARPLGSVVAETMRGDSPTWYFPLDESAESTSVGDRVAGVGSLEVLQIGAGGGELTFAAGTGPGTDGTSAPMFAPVSVTEGKYLHGDVPTFDLLGVGLTLRASFQSSAASVSQCIAEWADGWNAIRISLETSAAGKAVLRYVNTWDAAGNSTITSANTYADGGTHSISATVTVSGADLDLVLTVDGVEVGTDTITTTYPGLLHQLSVGGTAAGRLFTGTISHVAGFLTPVPLANLIEQHGAASTGFSGETSDARIARIASWIGIDPTLLDLDVGLSTIGHVDSTGKSAWSYMQDVADTEAGVLFIATDGRLRFHNRTRALYGADAPVDVTVSADVVDPGVRIVLNLDNIANDVSVAREGGATFRVTDATSIASYGLFGDSLTTLCDTDGEALARAQWVIAERANPAARLPELTLDALSEPTSAESVRAIDIGSRVQVTGMPSQAPRATEDLRVQGYAEKISVDGWTVAANTTPYLTIQPMIADDAVYGLADDANVAAY